MSAIVIFQQSDAVHLITDGAVYNHDGVIMRLASKVATLRRSNCALAIRGTNWPMEPLTSVLSLASSLDGIVDMLPGVMTLMLHEFDRVHGPDVTPIDRHFEVTIAGWSDRMQRMAAGIAMTRAPCDREDVTGASFLDGYQPCVPWVPAQGYTAPPVDFEAVLGRAFTTQADIDALHPELDGFALHDAQRTEGGIYCGQAAYLVGGFAELTSVHRGRVERRVLHSWPDQVGLKITPAGAAPLEFVQAVVDADRARSKAFQAYEAARNEARRGIVPTIHVPVDQAA